jgi:hypothetical protein
MQERHFNETIPSAFNGSVSKPVKPANVIAEENKRAVETKFGTSADAPKAPDEAMIIRMREYAVQLKKENKTLSKRQIRNMVKEKFNVTVFK